MPATTTSSMGMGTSVSGFTPGSAPPMGGMEHPMNTIGVPPLVDRRVLLQFCEAARIQASRDGIRGVVDARLTAIRGALARLQDLAALTRLMVLGHPNGVARVRDELACLVTDFPADPAAIRNATDDGEEEDEPETRFQLALVFDLMAGAAFVSKDNDAQRDRFIASIVRAVASAISFPVVYAEEAAAFVGAEPSALAVKHVSLVIANATRRLLADDIACDPALPPDIARQLTRMARAWMDANPVTAMLDALTGSRVAGILAGIDPDDAAPGDRVTLTLKAGLASDSKGGASDTGAQIKDLFVLFCPAEQADVVGVSAGRVVVQVPTNARTGPIAIVRTPDVTEVQYLLQQYAAAYPVAWYYSLFSFIPMWKWAYPAAFGEPVIEITPVPHQVQATGYTGAGPLGTGTAVNVGDQVVIHYRVDPPGSDGNAPLAIDAPSGTVTRGPAPGTLIYTPSQYGDGTVTLGWGSATETVTVRATRPAGGAARRRATDE